MPIYKREKAVAADLCGGILHAEWGDKTRKLFEIRAGKKILGSHLQ